jgi:hypothetical protein
MKSSCRSVDGLHWQRCVAYFFLWSLSWDTSAFSQPLASTSIGGLPTPMPLYRPTATAPRM